MTTCTIIAGPNGAGKTTFALKYLPRFGVTGTFINADLIAAGLSPLSPETSLLTASRIFLEQIETAINKQIPFCFETTLSGKTYLRLIERLKADNWRVELFYLALPNLILSKLRVKERVRTGGHNIPEQDLNRRFQRSLRNFLSVFAERVDAAYCLMNVGDEPELIFQQNGEQRIVHHEAYYQKILEEAR